METGNKTVDYSFLNCSINILGTAATLSSFHFEVMHFLKLCTGIFQYFLFYRVFQDLCPNFKCLSICDKEETFQFEFHTNNCR